MVVASLALRCVLCLLMADHVDGLLLFPLAFATLVLGKAYGVARAHNRAMVTFTSVDPRLLATCYVPLADFAQARAMAAEAVRRHGADLLRS